MYTLRRINTKGEESNQFLGDSYHPVMRHQGQEFESLLEPWPNQNEIFGFIVHDKGSSVRPLYKKSEYYIMSSNGQTFSTIKYDSVDPK